MEYLMTYGWAILVVVAVVAALYGLGVFKGGTGSAVKCSPCFSYFAYVDYADGTLKVTNGPNAMYITNITGLGVWNYTAYPAGNSVTAYSPGDSMTISNISTTGNQQITVTYVVNASSLSHTDTATIHN